MNSFSRCVLLAVMTAMIPVILFASGLYSPGYHFPSSTFPPEGTFVIPIGQSVTWSSGIMMMNVVEYGLDPQTPLPPTGENKDYSFTGNMRMMLTFNGGSTWGSYDAVLTSTINLAWYSDSATTTIYSGLLSSMAVSGGTLSSGVMIRNNGLVQSIGVLRTRPDGSGYQVSSFFDVYLEISTDYGLTWLAANNVLTLECVSFFDAVTPVLAPSSKMPPAGKFVQVGAAPITWGSLFMGKGFVMRDLSHMGYLPQMFTSQTTSLPLTMDVALSTDMGATWTTTSAPASMSIRCTGRADSTAGGTQLYEEEIQSMTLSGGSLPLGIMVRESPTIVSPGRMVVKPASGGYMISSFFDVFLEMSSDGGISWWSASNPVSLQLIYPAESPFPDVNFPPVSSFYRSGHDEATTFYSGLQLRNINYTGFSGSYPPPSTGSAATYTTSGTLSLEYSVDGGTSWAPTSGSANWQVRLASIDDDGSARFFDGEVQSLNISTGAGFMIRESPTKFSSGRHAFRPDGLVYQVSSFFDVFLEFSVDGGMSWFPAENYMTLSIYPACPVITIDPAGLPGASAGQPYAAGFIASGGISPYIYSVSSGSLPAGISLDPGGGMGGTPVSAGVSGFTIQANDVYGCTGSGSYILPVYPPAVKVCSQQYPPVGKYRNESGENFEWPVGIFIRSIILRDLDHAGLLPAPLNLQMYQFTGTIDAEISMDGGSTYQFVHAPVVCSAVLTHQSDDGDVGNYSMEMLQFDINGGDLQAGVKLRESPTLGSVGALRLTGSGQCALLESFFDIYLECSVDGGQSWMAQMGNPVTMCFESPGAGKYWGGEFPPLNGVFNNPKDEVLSWPLGVKIRNVAVVNSMPSSPLPPLQFNYTYPWLSELWGEMTTDWGLTWQTVNVPTTENVYIQPWDDEGTARFCNLEKTSWTIQGGNLPASFMLRESPTRPSTGRVWTNPAEGSLYSIGSFFDIFLELSRDGGLTWEPADRLLTLTLNASTIPCGGHAIAGWNMVSVPLIVSDYCRTALYPDAISRVFSYDGSYRPCDTLENGPGYWVKLPQACFLQHEGSIIYEDSIPVTTGWNMIGSVSMPVPVGSITSEPAGIRTSQFFGYTGRYVPTDTIWPRYGYWVKVNQAGTIILAPMSGQNVVPELSRIQIVPTREMPPPPPGEVLSGTADIPSEYSLAHARPNPFNPMTSIEFQLPVESRVNLRIYTITGQHIATLVAGDLPAGNRTVIWEAGSFGSGVYICRMEAVSKEEPVRSFSATEKLLLIK